MRTSWTFGGQSFFAFLVSVEHLTKNKIVWSRLKRQVAPEARHQLGWLLSLESEL